MSSRKERKEALRREREAREAAAREAERRRRLVGYGVGGALAVAAVAILVVLLVAGGGDSDGKADELLPEGGRVPEQRTEDLGRAVAAAGCKLDDNRVRVGTTSEARHTADPNERIPYQSNPPAGGKHYQIPAEDGAYGEAPPDTALVHSLEHGRVVVWFKPSLPKRVRADLKALFDEDDYQMLIVPRSNMRFAVAATAWGRDPEPVGTGYVLGCARFGERDFDALRAFRNEHRGNGPEPVP